MRSKPKQVKSFKVKGWHRWFAWRPVRMLNPGGTLYRWVWLEWIERKILIQPVAQLYYYRYVQYRPFQTEEEIENLNE